MPKAPKGSVVDKYPGLKEFATRVFRQTPATQHDSLRVELSYFVNRAKSSGEATKMNWTKQTLQKLRARFGSPNTGALKTAAKLPSQNTSGPHTKSAASQADQLGKHAHAQTQTQTQTRGAVPNSKGKKPIVSTITPPDRKEAYSPQDGQRQHAQAFGSASVTEQAKSSKKARSWSKSKQKASPKASQKASQQAASKPKALGAGAGAGVGAGTGSLPGTGVGNGNGISALQEAVSASSGNNSPLVRQNGVTKGSQSSAKKTTPLMNTPAASGAKKQQVKAAVAAERRRARFEAPTAGESPYMELHIGGPIVGTNQNLEKSYFRLTGQVNAGVVRPPEVIERALQYVYGKYEQDRSNYSYISDQLKSLRQDLTVQHIVSAVTVRVYEYNARVAIEHDDLGEYNQCSAQLHALYSQARTLEDRGLASNMLKNRKEFLAYVIYYKIYVGAWEELGVLLRELGGDEATKRRITTLPSKMLRRALECVTMVMTRQDAALFSCWRNATPLERKLIGKFALREQLRALEAIARATSQQNQTLPLRFVGRGMGLSDMDEICAFLDTWDVPHDGTHMSSVEALPSISRALGTVSGPADIKGQI